MIFGLAAHKCLRRKNASWFEPILLDSTPDRHQFTWLAASGKSTPLRILFVLIGIDGVFRSIPTADWAKVPN
jgi:hypothetical protein